MIVGSETPGDELTTSDVDVGSVSGAESCVDGAVGTVVNGAIDDETEESLNCVDMVVVSPVAGVGGAIIEVGVVSVEVVVVESVASAVVVVVAIGGVVDVVVDSVAVVVSSQTE